MAPLLVTVTAVLAVVLARGAAKVLGLLVLLAVVLATVGALTSGVLLLRLLLQ